MMNNVVCREREVEWRMGLLDCLVVAVLVAGFVSAKKDESTWTRFVRADIREGRGVESQHAMNSTDKDRQQAKG
jgi:hypothetical protein